MKTMSVTVTTGPDPRTILLDEEGSAVIGELLAEQEEAFERKFGRPMGPNDPIFFNPEADEPEPLSEQQVAKMTALMEHLGLGEPHRSAREAELEARGQILRPGDVGYQGPPESPRKARARRARRKKR